MNDAEVIGTLSAYRRAWFDLDGRGAVYLRFGVRAVGSTLDVSAIEVIEAHRRRGVFSATIAQCERIARVASRDCVYVECIHNPIVVDALARRGYTVTGDAPEWTAVKRLDD